MTGSIQPDGSRRCSAAARLTVTLRLQIQCHDFSRKKNSESFFRVQIESMSSSDSDFFFVKRLREHRCHVRSSRQVLTPRHTASDFRDEFIVKAYASFFLLYALRFEHDRLTS